MILKQILTKVLIKEGISSFGNGWLWTQLYKNINNLDISIYKTRSNNINQSHSYRVVVPYLNYQPPYAVIEFNNSDFFTNIWNTKNKNAKRWLVNHFENFEHFHKSMRYFTVVLCNGNSSSEQGHYDFYSGGNGIHAVAGTSNNLLTAIAEFGNLNKQYPIAVQNKNIHRLLLNFSYMETATHEFQHWIQDHVYTKNMDSEIDVKINVPKTVTNVFKIACYVCKLENIVQLVDSNFIYNKKQDNSRKINQYFPDNSINIEAVFEKLKLFYLNGQITEAQLYKRLNGLQMFSRDDKKGFLRLLNQFKSPNKSALTKKNQKILQDICKNHKVKFHKTNTSSDTYLLELPFSKTQKQNVHPFDQLSNNINDDKPWEELATELDAEFVANLLSNLQNLDYEYHKYVWFAKPKSLQKVLKKNMLQNLNNFDQSFIEKNNKQLIKLKRLSEFIIEKGMEVNEQINTPDWILDALQQLKNKELKIKLNTLYTKNDIQHERWKEFRAWQKEYWVLLINKIFER